MALREFSIRELSRYDGTGDLPVLVACQGKVYDVSRSFLWKKGAHQVLHRAGCDLSAAMVDAPHGIDLLQKFPIVGVLVTDR